MRNYLIIALAFLGWTVKAQDSLKTVNLDEVVITGTKSEIPVEKSGKTIFKLTKKDIDANSGKSVADLLNEVPGVQTDGNFGPLGTNVSYFIRGASSKQTLVLIDGVPYNDPSGVDQTYDLRLLDLNQVESIEILKGGLSTLYGTGAAAGVINITLKKTSSDSFEGNAKMEYGSFNTIAPGISFNGAKALFNYMFSGSYKKSDGFSAANDELNAGNYDDDGFEGYNFLGKLRYEFLEEFEIGATISLDNFKTDFDAGAFFDGDNTSDYQQLRVGLSPKFKWKNGNLRAEVFYSKLDRLFNSPDFFDPSQRFINEYDAKSIQADIILDQNINSFTKLIGGLNFQNSSFSQPAVAEADFNIFDPYVSLIFDKSNFNLQVGSRLNNHNEYGSHLIYNINPSYFLKSSDDFSLKFISSYSTSFITPSLYQLYGSFGNLDLNPEESQSTETGVSLYLSKLTASAVYFYRKDEELITFRSSFDSEGNFIGEYFNAESTIETDGIELDMKHQIRTNVTFSANYSYVRTLNDVVLYRIPENKYGFSINYKFMDGVNVGLKHLHTGGRIQPVFNNATFVIDDVPTSAFDLVDLFASYQIDNFTISGAINNVLDEKYIAIIGFNTIGKNYNLGIRYDF